MKVVAFSVPVCGVVQILEKLAVNMTKKYLVEFEVEAHGALVPSLAVGRSIDPRDGVEFEVENLRIAPGADNPLLLIRATLPAVDLQNAIEAGVEKVADFLHHLSFVTSMRFRIYRLTRVIDWTPGIQLRDYCVYSTHGAPEIPFQILDHEQFASVEVLLRTQAKPAFKRALKWYAHGVAAEEPEDQFQYFWLAVEVLSTLSTGGMKTSDKCPRCKTDLFCPSCQVVPTHRQYPSQRIRELFGKYVRGDHSKFFEEAQQVRHLLAHGEDFDEHATAAEHVVDALGRLAWTVLMDNFMTLPKLPFPDGRKKSQLALLQPSTFMHPMGQVGVHLQVQTADPDNPYLAEFPAVETTRELSPRGQN